MGTEKEDVVQKLHDTIRHYGVVHGGTRLPGMGWIFAGQSSEKVVPEPQENP